MFGFDAQLTINPPPAHLGGTVRTTVTGAGSSKAHLPRTPEVRLALTDPATWVVTDFAREPPVTVPESRAVDHALSEMIRAGVRALLVTRDDVVTGLVTSYDIQGERPLQFLAVSGYGRHDEIEVGHVMTPWEQVMTLDWRAVSEAHVSDVVKTFRSTFATHIVLVEYPDQDGMFVRGLISRTRLERQLGHPI